MLQVLVGKQVWVWCLKCLINSINHFAVNVPVKGLALNRKVSSLEVSVLQLCLHAVLLSLHDY